MIETLYIFTDLLTAESPFELVHKASGENIDTQSI